MKGCDGTETTIGDVAYSLTAYVCVGLPLRLCLLTASSACRVDMRGIG
jgi:hypothetical protein